MTLVFLKTMSLWLRISVQLEFVQSEIVQVAVQLEIALGQKARSPVGSNSEHHFSTAVEVHIAQCLNTFQTSSVKYGHVCLQNTYLGFFIFVISVMVNFLPLPL